MQQQRESDNGANESGGSALINEIISAATVGAVEAQIRAEVDIQIATAKRYPRNLLTCKSNALAMATMTQSIAEDCIYTVPRAGESISGPSIRLAEIIIHAWGHMRVYSRIIEIGPETLTIQGTAHDLQTNNLIQAETMRRIVTSKGKRYSADMIAMTANAAASIAIRNATFRVIPQAWVNPIFEACKKTAIGDGKDLPQRLEKMIAAFAKLGVESEQLARFAHAESVNKINAEGLYVLVGVFNSIRDGEASVEEIFGVASAVAKNEKAKTTAEKLTAALQPAQPAPAEKAAPPMAPVADVLGVAPQPPQPPKIAGGVGSETLTLDGLVGMRNRDVDTKAVVELVTATGLPLQVLADAITHVKPGAKSMLDVQVGLPRSAVRQMCEKWIDNRATQPKEPTP